MSSKLKIKANNKIKAYYVFFLIFTLQKGVGIVGYPRVVVEKAGPDAWISLIIALIFVHIFLQMIIFILRSYDNTDLHGILEQSLGKWLGKMISLSFMLFYMTIILSIVVTYVEFVLVFLFPRIQGWFIAGLILLLVIYAVYGGIKAVVGVSFIFYLFTEWMILLFIEPAMYFNKYNFLPILDTSFGELMQGVLVTSYTVTGFELIWFFYPFIDDKKKVARYGHLGVAIYGLTILIITVIIIGYFSLLELKEEVWPLLQMLKIVKLPLFERFDIIIVALWMLIILPNLVTLTWIASFGIKRITNLRQRTSLLIISILVFIGSFFLKDRISINNYNDLVATISIFYCFGIPLLLFPFAIIKRRKGKKQNENA